MLMRTFGLALLFSMFVAFSLVSSQANGDTYTFYPLADTWLPGYDHQNDNKGLLTHLTIQHGDRFSHVLVRFSQDEIASSIGVVVVDDTPCNATEVETLSPGWIPADGSNHTIQATGSGLSNVYEVLKNGVAINYTIVDDSTLTFVDSAAVEEEHRIQISSSCLTSPIDLFVLEAGDPDDPKHAPSTVICGVPGAVTYFSMGYDDSDPSKKKYLCYNKVRIKLIGDGHLPGITDDEAYVDSGGSDAACMVENHACAANSSTDTRTRTYFENARYFTHSGGGHGSNMNRVWVHGYSFRYVFGSESVPFKGEKASYNYDIKGTPVLRDRYINRLRQVLTGAKNNGQTVQLSLFDHIAFRDKDAYVENPWQPGNSDMENCGLPTSNGQNNASAEFYDICNDTLPEGGKVCSNLNCLGGAQKNLVDRIMYEVKYGNNGSRFRNVFIELGNETVEKSGMDHKKYMTWHKTVSKWVKDKGKYIISVNPGPEAQGQRNGDYTTYNHKYIFDCSPTSCTNQYQVVLIPKIDILALHGGAWEYNANGTFHYEPCALVTEAMANFSKPLIIDDDGNYARGTNGNLDDWAGATTTSCSGITIGKAHYNHLEEGSDQPNPLPACTPQAKCCDPSDLENYFIDCQAYNLLGDTSSFSDICSITSACTTLSESSQYCIVQGCYNP